MSSRFQIVMKAKLKKKRQAERAKKNGERPRVPWRWANDSASFKANVGDVVSEKLTFKEYLKEVKYYRQKEEADWQDDIDEHGVGIGVCPRCDGEARYVTDWAPHGGMWSYWSCQNPRCGYEDGTGDEF